LLLHNYVSAVGTSFQILTFADYTGGFTVHRGGPISKKNKN
jgi:hypothetical protein